MLPSVTLSPKSSQVLMALDLKDEHKEHGAPLLQAKPQILDMLSTKHASWNHFFLGTDEVWILSSSTEASSQ